MYIIYNAYAETKGGYERKFLTYKDLVNWLSKFNRDSFEGKRNSFLDRTGCCDNDVYTDIPRHSFGIFGVNYYPRLNRIMNEDGNNIYDSKLVKDVLNTKFDQDMDIRAAKAVNGKQNKWCHIGFRSFDSKLMPEFRRGPIPYVISRRNYNPYRHPKTINTRRQASDPEMMQFMRKKDVDNLPDGWMIESLRDWRNTGWKRQGKHRKQWEKKAKRHSGKGVYVVKHDMKHDYIDYADCDDSVEEIDICA